MRVIAYLSFNGNCEAAIKFYEKALGGKLGDMFRYGGTPAMEHAPADWDEKIMHVRLDIGSDTIMASDAPPGQYQKPQGFSISLHPTTVAETEQVFNALAQNGQVIMPLMETFWAARFGMLVDRFGIPWMVNCERPA